MLGIVILSYNVKAVALSVSIYKWVLQTSPHPCVTQYFVLACSTGTFSSGDTEHITTQEEERAKTESISKRKADSLKILNTASVGDK